MVTEATSSWQRAISSPDESASCLDDQGAATVERQATETDTKPRVRPPPQMPVEEAVW